MCTLSMDTILFSLFENLSDDFLMVFEKYSHMYLKIKQESIKKIKKLKDFQFQFLFHNSLQGAS